MSFPLDLTSHLPEEFEGKSISLSGHDYIVGPLFRYSEQGHAHQLINVRSRLPLHIVQIRCSYMAAPEDALAASRLKAKLNNELRTKMAAAGQDVQIPVVSCHEAHGGCFELHELPHGSFFPVDGMQEVAQAQARRLAGDTEGAIHALNALLQQLPNHTAALSELAWSLHAAGRHVEALDTMEHLVAIEPHMSAYWGQRMLLRFGSHRPCGGIPAHEELRRRYPTVHDFDAQAVDAMLWCGEPGLARACLGGWRRDGGGQEELEQKVDAALEHQAQARAMIEPVRQAMRGEAELSGERILALLSAAHELDPRDSVLSANLAFALARSGQHQRAAELLLSLLPSIIDRWMPYCTANAAFNLYQLPGQLQRAIELFDMTMQYLRALHVEPSALDAPGVAVWIGDGSVIESIHPAAATLIDDAIERCTDAAPVSPAVRSLASLYRAAQSKLELTPPNGSQLFHPPPSAQRPWWKRLWTNRQKE